MLEKIVGIGSVIAGFYESSTGVRMFPYHEDSNFTPALCVAAGLGASAMSLAVKEDMCGKEPSFADVFVYPTISACSYFVGYAIGSLTK